MRLLPIALLLAFIALPFSALAQVGQSTLNFPYAVTPESVRTVGLAFVNPTSTSATVTIKSFCTAPTACTVGDETGSATITLPARGQLANLFAEFLPNSLKGGWVQAISPTAGVLGFEIVGDFVRMVDGVEPASPARDQIVPIVGDAFSLYAANPGTSSITLTLRFYDGSGAEIAPARVSTLTAHGSSIFELKSGQNPTYASARYVRATATDVFSAMAAVRDVLPEISGPDKDLGTINGIDAAQLGTELNFPHVISGNTGSLQYTTLIGVTNATSQSQSVSLSYRLVDGSAVTISKTLPANGSFKESVDTLFGQKAGFQDGWVQVTGAGQITGFSAFAEKTASGLAVVGVQRAASTNLIFGQIADLNPWQTGLALLNTGSTPASVEVFAMNADGTLIGGAANIATAKFTLSPRTKTARLLSEWIPQTQSRVSDGGFILVRTTNNVPLYGLELFFLRSGTAFANVPGSLLPTGLTYLPPVPLPPTVSSLSPSSVSSGIVRSLTVSGANFQPGLTATLTTPIGSRPASTATFVSSGQVRVGVLMEDPPSGQSSYVAKLTITNPDRQTATASFTVAVPVAPATTGTVAGRVTAPAGVALSGIEVQAVSFSGGTIRVGQGIVVSGFERTIFKTQTDADGNFVLDGLPPNPGYSIAPFRPDLTFTPQIFPPSVPAGRILSVEFVASLSNARPSISSVTPKAARCGTRPSGSSQVPDSVYSALGLIKIFGSDLGLGTAIFADSDGNPTKGVQFFEQGYGGSSPDSSAPSEIVGQFVCDGSVKNGVQTLAIKTGKGLSTSVNFPIQLPPNVTAAVARDPATGQTLTSVSSGQTVRLEVTGTDLNDTVGLRLFVFASGPVDLALANLQVSSDGTSVNAEATIPANVAPGSYPVLVNLDTAVLNQSTSSGGSLTIR